MFETKLICRIKSWMKKMCKWVGRSIRKITVIIVIIGVLVFSRSVLRTVFNAKEQLIYESQSSGKCSEEVCGSISVKKAATMQIPKCCSMCAQQPENAPITKCHCNYTGSKKVFLYHVLCIVFIIVLGVTVTVLLMLLIKDDSGIRYEKLDELNSIKDKLLECNTEIAWGKNKDVTKTVANEKNECTETTTTKKIYNRIDLLKHYMSCVTDV